MSYEAGRDITEIVEPGAGLAFVVYPEVWVLFTIVRVEMIWFLYELNFKNLIDDYRTEYYIPHPGY